jgi:chitinase
MKTAIFLFLCGIVFLFCSAEAKQKLLSNDVKEPFTVIAYYSGNGADLDNYAVEKITHIIFSFCHLKGNRLNVDNKGDTATIQKLVLLKQRNPSLKIMLSLGGWTGCKTCSDVFSTSAAREKFAASVKELNDYFKTDGIDLDWEYPAIEGPPGHPFKKEDKENFTALIKLLRQKLGRHEISFAAGGFDDYLSHSIDWKQVMPLVNRVNLMSYDLVGGYHIITGHHTPLYSTAIQKQSANNAIEYFKANNIALNKIAIGAAFYGRTWQNVDSANNGLNQSGRFKDFISYARFNKDLSGDSGYVFFRDPVAQAPYAYNKRKRIFATFDDSISIRLKTNYAKKMGLNGIMFWELSLDKPTGGLLEVINKAIKE